MEEFIQQKSNDTTWYVKIIEKTWQENEVKFFFSNEDAADRFLELIKNSGFIEKENIQNKSQSEQDKGRTWSVISLKEKACKKLLQVDSHTLDQKGLSVYVSSLKAAIEANSLQGKVKSIIASFIPSTTNNPQPPATTPDSELKEVKKQEDTHSSPIYNK